MSKDLAQTCGNNSRFIDIAEISTSEDMIKPNCKLCNSKFRKEAESLAERGQSITTILRFLDQSGDSISYGAINNHINFHFKAKQSETDLLEYAGQLEKWAKKNRADDVLLTRYVIELDMEATSLLAKNANLDHVTRLKNNETILKIRAMILQLKETLRKLHAELTPIEILFASLDRIIEVKLKSGITIEARRALQDVIEQLKKEVGEVAIEGKKSEE